MVLLLSSELKKTRFQTSVYLNTNTGMSTEYRFYISPSIEGVVMVSMNYIDTYIVNKTVLEPILREDSIYGPTFIVRRHSILFQSLGRGR